MNKIAIVLVVTVLVACSKKQEHIKPIQQPITVSVYASGVVKASQQYQAYAGVTGILKSILIQEGEQVKVGTPLFVIQHQSSSLNKENALLNKSFNELKSNQLKLDELKLAIETSRLKYQLDSSLYAKQLLLFKQNVGSQLDVEQKALALKSSDATYKSALIKYDETNRQLSFLAKQAQNNYLLSQTIEGDFIVKSEVEGTVFTVFKEQGEMINQQAPLAIIGNTKTYTIELLVDEYDMVKIKPGMKIIIALDSYKNQVFEAVVSRIDPYLNERTKTCKVEANFVKQPPLLYPNLTVEANIILSTKPQALTIPLRAILPNGKVKLLSGEEVEVKTGLRDYEKVEILSGLSASNEIILQP